MEQIVRPGDTLLLHYRISTADGSEIDSTFAGEPLVLHLGVGEFAENLEQWLIGLPPGERHVFQLEPEQAFGVSDAALVQRVPLDQFPPDMALTENAVIEFQLPDGAMVAGTVKSKSQHDALVDFNHPLSDCPILFEVEVLEIVR